MDGKGWSRRSALQTLAAGLGGVAWASDTHAAHPIVAHLQRGAARPATDGGLPRFLDEHQFRSLSTFAEIVVPGATTTRSDVFIDTLLAVESTAAKRRFLVALGAIDGAAIAAHRAAFLDLTPADRLALLTDISRQPSGRETPAVAGTSASTPVVTLRDQFEHLKGWVAGAYYSSEAGMRELGWTEAAFFPAWPACDHGEHR